MDYIRVLNYTSSPVILHGMHRSYEVQPGTTEHPGSEDISMEDVSYINSKSRVFLDGTVCFEPDAVEMMMDKLHNAKWRESYTPEQDVIDAILHPTYHKMMRVVTTTSMDVIERYRAAMVRIQNEGRYGVSNAVENIIRQRFTELNRSIMQSKIQPPSVFDAAQDTPHANDALKAENDALRAQLAKLEAMMQNLSASKPVAEEGAAGVVKKTTRSKTPRKSE